MTTDNLYMFGNGTYRYLHCTIPKRIRLLLIDVWHRHTPFFLTHYREVDLMTLGQYVEFNNYVGTGSMNVFNDKEGDSKIWGKIDFSIHHGRYNENLQVNIKYLHYESHFDLQKWFYDNPITFHLRSVKGWHQTQENRDNFKQFCTHHEAVYNAVVPKHKELRTC